jgi:small conductance mechanosensitive channel
MNSSFGKFWDAAHHMIDSFIGRLPALIVAVVVFILFYGLSLVVSRIIRQAIPHRRQNLGVVFARLTGGATILVGFLVAFSIVAPSFQAADLIKILGISGVAIGFAFQNILQNFLAGLLLLWTEPFRVGDEIKLDTFEGTVVDIQTRATIIKTYDERQVVIPNADLFTHSVVVNTAFNTRRWEYDLQLKNVLGLAQLKFRVLQAVRAASGVLSQPAPEAFIVNLDAPNSEAAKLRVLWWTNAPRQHQMLDSYDRVLTAIAEALSQPGTGGQSRAA